MQKPNTSALNSSSSKTMVPFSLVDPASLSLERVISILDKASSFESGFAETAEKIKVSKRRATIALLFFEPSTRTRFSFSIAGQKLGHNVILFDSAEGTSLKKGESIEDTIQNINAMEPDLLIIRCGGEVDLLRISESLATPVINAGWGHFSHPTQALLDAYTLQHEFDGRPINILLVGDLSHSRVAFSNIEILRKLGHTIAIHSPWQYTPKGLPADIQIFDDLDEGLRWAQSAMFLRVQHERHNQLADEGKQCLESQVHDGSKIGTIGFNGDLYHLKHGLTAERLKCLPSHFKILHPGPVQYGVEVCNELKSDPRSLILKQVKNGVLIRAAVMDLSLSRSLK